MTGAPRAPRTIVLGEAEITDLDPSGGAGSSEAAGRSWAVDPTARAPAVGWWAAIHAAIVVSFGRPRVRALALLAFLGRGGIVALGLPIVVLPGPIGIGIWVGPTSVTAAGPTPRLVAAIVVAVVAAAVVVIVAFTIAAAAEVALHQAVAAPDPDEPEAGIATVPPAGRGARATFRVLLVRLVLLVPVIGAVGLAIPLLVEAGYRELTLPSNVAVPLAVRIIQGAPVAGISIVATWLTAEVVGGLAGRHVVLFGAGVLQAVGMAFVDVVRRPGSMVIAIVASGVVSAALFVPAEVAAFAVWDRAQTVLSGEPRAVDAVLAGLAVTATFAGTVVLAAWAAAFRAALWTAQVLRLAGIRPPGS